MDFVDWCESVDRILKSKGSQMRTGLIDHDWLLDQFKIGSSPVVFANALPGMTGVPLSAMVQTPASQPAAVVMDPTPFQNRASRMDLGLTIIAACCYIFAVFSLGVGVVDLFKNTSVSPSVRMAQFWGTTLFVVPSILIGAVMNFLAVASSYMRITSE